MTLRIGARHVFLFFVLALFTNLQAQNDRRDGNWWLAEKSDVKLPYVLGFFDGVDLGYSFSLGDGWTNSAERACFESVSKSYVKQRQKYFGGVKVSQVVDGLDEFYKDYRNRSIDMPNAFELVLRSVAGEDIEQLTIQYRKMPK